MDIMIDFDYEDIQFDEIDNSEYPPQAYYWWAVETSTIRDLMCECEISSENEDFDNNTELSARLVLTIYTKAQFKVELLVEDEFGKQNWYIVCFDCYAANGLTELIPNYNEIIDDLEARLIESIFC